jgi:hypothetical protein
MNSKEAFRQQLLGGLPHHERKDLGGDPELGRWERPAEQANRPLEVLPALDESRPRPR